jgi:hypothetical protein
MLSLLLSLMQIFTASKYLLQAIYCKQIFTASAVCWGAAASRLHLFDEGQHHLLAQAMVEPKECFEYFVSLLWLVPVGPAVCNRHWGDQEPLVVCKRHELFIMKFQS